MRWLYRLQARMGMTAPEGGAAVAVLLALLGGVVAQHVQRTADPLPPGIYAAADAAFFAPRDSSVDSTQSPATPQPVAPLALLAPIEPDAAPADSTPAQIAEAVVETAAAPRRSGKPPPAPTNINTASAAELQRLPRIGPALAGRIIEHRRVHGPFRHPDRIVDVRGIGPKTLEKLRPWIHL